ncbi:MAG: hypothetical protein WD075_05070 [Rhodospirillales bacterium]
MPNVEVRDADGNLLHTYQIITEDYGNLIKEDYVIEIAKINALEDKLVPESRAGELIFSVIT